MNKQTKLIMAKDHYQLKKLAKQLKNYPNQDSKEYLTYQQKYQQLLIKSQEMAQARLDSVPKISLNEDLPVSQQADLLVKAIQNHQVIIVAGETGSGKTTQLPKIALLAGRGITGQIGHTQPRRLAARSVANRIAEELGEPLGKSVSFKVRFTEQGSANSLIKLMTDGILLAELAHDKFLTRYDTIIIDEAHERSLNIDFILGYLKNLLPKRPDLKLIITSATLDTERFSQYFANVKTLSQNKRNHQLMPAPVYVVEGRSYPVEVRYRPLTEMPVHGSDDDDFDDIEENLPKAIISAIEECYADAQQKRHIEQADILVFMATEAEIREMEELLTAYVPKHTQILPLFARQSFAEQQRIFQPTSGRRIILATNVAETALTVPNIRYVIDLGFARISRYDYRSRVQRLPIEAISQAAANQRKGRCGRIASGLCIRLYSEEDFNSRPEFTEPEILRTNLASVILQMANLGLGNVESFDFIQPPDNRLIKDGRKLLEELNAITYQSSQSAKTKNPITVLTKVGKMMAKMPIDPRLARMLVAGEKFGCLQELLVIVSALSVQDPRERPIEKQAQADQKHALFRQDNSDFLFYISLWQAVFGSLWQNIPLSNTEQIAPSPYQLEHPTKLSNSQRKNFAKKHFLSPPRLREWQQTYVQLTQMTNELKLSINQEPASFAQIHRALLSGLLSFIANKVNELDTNGKVIKNKRGEYLVARQSKAKIFPASSLFKQPPSWVMAFEIVETSQVFMRNLAKIEPEWILSAAGNLLKYHYFEPHWSVKTGHVKAYAQISLFGLVIVHKQLMNYEQVNIAEAHDIFLRDALVLGQLNQGREPPFLQHNLKKIANVSLIEEKLRRRDLLVDEEILYQFYAERVPENIASRKAFEDWRKDIERKNPQFLFFNDSDVLTEQAPNTQDFPEIWQLGSLKLPLSYVFDPASDDDGVTIKVPLMALPQLDSIEILWGIKGWRYELVLQLLKTLPKDIRRQLVPIPETARTIYQELNQHHHAGLLKQLCQALIRRGINNVKTTDFNSTNIERYLQPQIALVDNKNRVIDKGRDIEALKLRHHTATSQAVTSNSGLHSEFPEHFCFVQHRHTAGVLVKQFSALVAEKITNNQENELKQKVAIQQFTDILSALTAHRRSVLILIKNELGAKAKQLTSQIDKSLKLAFAPLGDLQQLKNLLIDATLDATFSQFSLKFCHDDILMGHSDKNLLLIINSLPLNLEEFQQTKQIVLANFLTVGQTVLQQLKHIYEQWQKIRQQLLMLDREIFAESMEDIEDQLDDLQLSDFIYRMRYEDWQQYPRYLQALLIRLERLEHNLDADLESVYALDIHMERLANRAGDSKIAPYRWLVEEYRIQLFAQPMKTRQAVSAKRLEKLWDSLQK